MSDLTKEQLLRKLEEAQSRIQEQDAAIAEKDARLADADTQIKKLHARGEGWLVTAPEPLYDGVTYGVKFLNGMAFIRKDQEVPHFVHPPLKDTALASLVQSQHPIFEGVTAEMRKNILAKREEAIRAVREREQVPSSERAALALASEFGYKAEYFDGEELAALQHIIDERAGQAAAMAEMVKAREQAGNIMPPGYMGQ